MTTSDLKSVSDQMNHEALSAKKCFLYSNQMQDPALKGIAQQLGQHHQQQYDRLYQYLNAQN